MLKMEAFRDTYLAAGAAESARTGSPPLRVLDLGAMAYAAQDSYRPLFDGPGFDYVGLDVAAGSNVDVVVTDPHHWPEVPTGSVDAVISGQAIEHDPQFWVTMAEISRVLRCGGWCCVVAPSTGPVHRFPQDCWRFYPDSAAALLAWAGLEVVETYVENRTYAKGGGIEWQDMMAIGRKPDLDDAEHERFLGRLAAIVASRCDVPPPEEAGRHGPAVRRFEAVARVPVWQRRPYALRAGAARARFALWTRLSPETQARIEKFRSR
jgi:SAM-dependent methyltransferase